MPLSQEDQAKYKALYLQSAREYVKELHDNVTVLITTPQDTDAVANAHRAAHSLNSQSHMMQFSHMGSVASVLEQLFKNVQDKKTELTQETLQLILEIVTDMGQNLDSIDTTNQETDLSQDAAKLQSLVS